MTIEKNHRTNVHILPDENLGGGPNGQILREFVEVDRKAKKGDKIVGKNTENIYEVDHVFVDVVSTKDKKYVHHYDYKVLEPTDIVHIDGQRFRLVDRKAKVGEKVIVVDAYINGESYKNGDIFVVREARHSVIFVTIGSGRHIALSHFEYNVLEPVEPTKITEPVEVDTRHASPQVIDMLANLAQRIAELERKINDMSVTLERHEHVNDRQNNEIDTLHANQRKLAEETTNRLDRHSERIRELAEMIGERKPYFKTFKPEIHFHIDNDKTPEDLAKSVLKALEEACKR
jgi:hypothetical protein